MTDDQTIITGTITGKSTPLEIFTDLEGFVDHQLTTRRIMFLTNTKTPELRGVAYHRIKDSHSGVLMLEFPLPVAPQEDDSFIIY